VVWKISGICTVEDVPTAGVKVYAFEEHEWVKLGEATSAEDGKYEMEVPPNWGPHLAHYTVVAEFEAGGIKYTAKACWFVFPYEVL